MNGYIVVGDGVDVVKAYTTPGPAKAYVTRWARGQETKLRKRYSHMAAYPATTAGLTPIAEAGSLAPQQVEGQYTLF